jgi:DNA polymerase III epsilon subunit-like protein
MEVDFYPSLDEAAAYLGVPIQEPRHSALGDAKTARGVLLKIASS